MENALMRALLCIIMCLITPLSAFADPPKDKLFIEGFGNSDNANQFKYELQSELSKVGFTLVDDKSDAYGVLNGFVNLRLVGQTPIFTGTNYTTDRYRADAQAVLNSTKGEKLWTKSFSNGVSCGLIKRHKNPLGCVAELMSKSLKENLLKKEIP